MVTTFNPSRFERAITRKGYTPADLAYEMRRLSAGRLKTTESQIYKWIRGDHVPSGAALAVAALALDVSVDSFFERDEADEEEEPASVLRDLQNSPSFRHLTAELQLRVRQAVERSLVEPATRAGAGSTSDIARRPRR
jgi:transcriptional regulator with XRE-family HTH domain